MALPKPNTSFDIDNLLYENKSKPSSIVSTANSFSDLSTSTVTNITKHQPAFASNLLDANSSSYFPTTNIHHQFFPPAFYVDQYSTTFQKG